jgi:uncharacterized pyridoxamine 5'-phosphate oxidase family protein
MTTLRRPLIVCGAALTELMLGDEQRMYIVDMQPYIANQLSKLARVEQKADDKKWYGDINLILPHGNDDATWSILVNNYKANNANDVYYIKNITNNANVSIVATDKNENIIGYVTCSVVYHEELYDQSASMPVLNDNLDRVNDEKTGPFNVFSIDGLHVDPTRRGGRTKSLANLLLFHALYFAKESAADLGIRLIASFSYARTTMINLTEFGFSHLNAEYALKWMGERVAPIIALRDRFNNGFHLLNLTKQLWMFYEQGDEREIWDKVLRENDALQRQKTPTDSQTTLIVIDRMRKELEVLKQNEEQLILEKDIYPDLFRFVNEFKPTANESERVNLYQQLQRLYRTENARYNASMNWLRTATHSDWDTVLYISDQMTNQVFQRQMAFYDALVKEGMKRQSDDAIDNEQITKKSRISHPFMSFSESILSAILQ